MLVTPSTSLGRAGGVGPGAGAEHEVEPVGRDGPGRVVLDRQDVAVHAAVAVDEGVGRGALACGRVLGGDRLVRAVGRDEVHERRRVLQVGLEIGPARVWLELAIAGHGVELGARLVERRHSGIAAARQVDRREIERQAEQVVAHRLGDELVDLVADLAGHAADDGAWAPVSSAPLAVNSSGSRNASIRAICSVSVADETEVGIEAVDRIGQQGVAEPIDDVCELGDDRGVDRGVIDLGRGEEDVDLRLDFACELLEHEVLILHLGAEAGGLEQALAIPIQRVDTGRRGREAPPPASAATD